jgi:hypothetical protein
MQSSLTRCNNAHDDADCNQTSDYSANNDPARRKQARLLQGKFANDDQ